MARPIILLSENVLRTLDLLHKTGVKYDTMIRQERISITSTTLKKKLKVYSALIQSKGELRDTIHKSMFPDWLDPNYGDIQVQPVGTWTYYGKFPYGDWESIQMILMSEEGLKMINAAHKLGADYEELIKDFNLSMSALELKVLIRAHNECEKYLEKYRKHYTGEDGYKLVTKLETERYETVFNSLNPAWVDGCDTMADKEQIQPLAEVYDGVFPSGKWKKRSSA